MEALAYWGRLAPCTFPVNIALLLTPIILVLMRNWWLWDLLTLSPLLTMIWSLTTHHLPTTASHPMPVFPKETDSKQSLCRTNVFFFFFCSLLSIVDFAHYEWIWKHLCNTKADLCFDISGVCDVLFPPSSNNNKNKWKSIKENSFSDPGDREEKQMRGKQGLMKTWLNYSELPSIECCFCFDVIIDRLRMTK